MDLSNIHKIAIIIDRDNDRDDRDKKFLSLSRFRACPLYMTEMTGMTGIYFQFSSLALFLIFVYTIWLNRKNIPVISAIPVNAVFVPKIALFLTEIDFTYLCQNHFISVTQAWSK